MTRTHAPFHVGFSYIGATTWQIHASDWLHNLDKKISHYFTVYRDDNDKTRLLKKKAVETELGCFGKDMVSISLAMTTSQLLWFGISLAFFFFFFFSASPFLFSLFSLFVRSCRKLKNTDVAVHSTRFIFTSNVHKHF